MVAIEYNILWVIFDGETIVGVGRGGVGVWRCVREGGGLRFVVGEVGGLGLGEGLMEGSAG